MNENDCKLVSEVKEIIYKMQENDSWSYIGDFEAKELYESMSSLVPMDKEDARIRLNNFLRENHSLWSDEEIS